MGQDIAFAVGHIVLFHILMDMAIKIDKNRKKYWFVDFDADLWKNDLLIV